MSPSIGDRRPRAGRCEQCDRPLSDEIQWDDGWYPESGPDSSRCTGIWSDEAYRMTGDGSACGGAPEYWRARALAAEAALERAVADADAQIVSVARESEARGRQHGMLAAALQIEGDRLLCEDQAVALRAQNDPESDSIALLHGLRANGLRTAIFWIERMAAEATDGQ